VVEPFAGAVAQVTHSVLGALGVDVLRAGKFLYAPGVFEYEIRPGCTGLLPVVVLVVAVLASPASARAKVLGVAVGIPLLLAVNVLRLAHLFYIGMRSPDRFVLAHTVLWESAMVVFTFAVWLVWVGWATRAARAQRPGSY